MNADPARGELREGDVRYLLIRADSLMGLFKGLPEPACSAALAAFADSVAKHGGRSAERYSSELNQEELLEKIESTACRLGWGVWKFEREGDSIGLTVENSPFAHGHGTSAAPVCAAIAGMLQAAATLVLGRECRAKETSCAAAGGASCRFRTEKR